MEEVPRTKLWLALHMAGNPFLGAVAHHAKDGDAPARMVVAARLNGSTWAEIADRVPGASAESMEQTHGGEYMVAVGYTRVHRLIDDIALTESWSRTTGQTLDALVADGRISADVGARVRTLGATYFRVLTGDERITDREASAGSDEAISLAATIYLVLAELSEQDD